MSKRARSSAFLLALLAGSGLAITGCDGDAENAAEDVGDAVDDAADEVGDAVDK